MRYFLLSALIAAGTLLAQCGAHAQPKASANAEQLADAVSRHQFMFDAVTTTPQRGNSRILTPGYYFLEIKEDSLICELPYFGRRYSVPANEELIYGGYQFSTRSFTYKSGAGKRGRVEIELATRPFNDQLSISLSITKSGWAVVQIQSSGRESISYYGSVTPLPESKTAP